MSRSAALGLLPIHFFETVVKGRRTFRYLRDLERSQWQPREALEAAQFGALTALVRHAFAHCPYYQERWKQDALTPDALARPADFQRWPVINQDTVRAHRLAMRATVPMPLIAKATGGSTGTPVSFD